ncbi:MAG TPA: tripartite tricarboxylate transporter substrate binding protein, partial [Burkholderiales bacterium]|nr:tripartite tricarboxylate transporter substrate binding protein [Burkholderiales bacterium]
MKAPLIAVALLLLAASPVSQAQNYPVKAVRLVVPFAPGGGTDLVARTLAQRLTEALGHTFVVENRGGAGGVIGADMVAKAPPDGYTLVMGTPGSMTINPNLTAKMPYDTLRDFAPISLATISPFVLTVHPSLPVKNLKAFIALAKAQPGRLNYGTSGNGSVAHLSTEYLKSLARIDLVHVPYKGSSLALTDTLAGQLQVLFDNLPVVQPHVRTGKLRLMGVGTQQRSALIPGAPTIAESGVPGYEASTAFGVMAPAQTPPAVVNRLSQEIMRILQSAEIKDRLATQGLEAVGSTPQQYEAHLR